MPAGMNRSTRQTASTMIGVRPGDVAKTALIATGITISVMLLSRLMREKRETRSAAPKRLPIPR